MKIFSGKLFFSRVKKKTLIADRLLQRQRTEVEDEWEGLNNIGCDEVILKAVMLTEVPNVANPMAHVLKSLTRKLDPAGEVVQVDSNSAHVDCSRDVSTMSHSAEVKRTHKVFVGDNLLNSMRIILN